MDIITGMDIITSIDSPFLYSLSETQVALQPLKKTVSVTHSLSSVHEEGGPSIPKVHAISEACLCVGATA